jgi:transcription initiation factor TFIID subunit 2
MPGQVELEAPQENTEPQFSVTHQDVELDVDFVSRKLVGLVTITIQPLSKDLRTIPLNCRGIDVKSIMVEGHQVEIPRSRDPYEAYRVREFYTVKQHEQIRNNIEREIKDPPESTLVITLPKHVRIKEFNPNNLSTNSSKVDSAIDAAMPISFEDGDLMFMPITLDVRYVVERSREAVRWVGTQEGDPRYPHMYTCASSVPGLFPCFAFPIVGSASSRCSWRLTINCPRTIGDFVQPKPLGRVKENGINAPGIDGHMNGMDNDTMDIDGDGDEPKAFYNLTNEEKDQEIQVVGSGLMEDSDVSGNAYG